MDRMEDLFEAVCNFANSPWAEMADQDHDASTNFTKVYKRWSDKDKPCSLHIAKLLDFAKREFYSITKALVRFKPALHFKGATFEASAVMIGDNLAKQEGLREQVEETLAKTHFRCEKARHLWIPKSTINCLECPHVMACATKGWEVNAS